MVGAYIKQRPRREHLIRFAPPEQPNPREASSGGAGIRIGSVWVCGFGAGCGEVSPPLRREAAVRFSSPTIASGGGGGAAGGPSSPPVAGLIQIERLGFLKDLGRVYGRLDQEF
ncbi:hypothetical protein GUJ93_ZPchr0458g22426 [Zizania palustris]|uniref:Uncharacterized protein n=1 Tax=Zizania palustris TaxID=103762 RepID=A0A8J5RDE2_ZIZPA|nr:hypothetical protein GUJ93_ZPchr0458g22426 [Zizania palustris]